MDHEIMRYVKKEISRQLNILLMAETVGADQFTESIAKLYPGMPTITERPLIQPFGLASKAPNGTQSLVARLGDHPGNRSVIGHRDANKPDVDVGESVVYSMGGYRVWIENDRVSVGKGIETQTVVCGDLLTEFLGDLLSLLAQHTHAGPGAPPTQAPQFTALKTNNIDNDALLAKDGGAF